MIMIETWNKEFSKQSPAVPDQVNGPQMKSFDIQKFIERIEKSSISNHVTKKRLHQVVMQGWPLVLCYLLQLLVVWASEASK